MLVMNPQSTASKVLLVADARAASPSGVTAPIRRYRIARVRPENRPVATRGDAASPATQSAVNLKYSG
jgi:hypothetical protein